MNNSTIKQGTDWYKAASKSLQIILHLFFCKNLLIIILFIQ